MFFVGVDVGQRRDHTAIVVVERMGPAPMLGASGSPEVQVRFAERVALGTPYPMVAERVRGVVWNLNVAMRMAWRSQTGCTVVVDATGVGAPVVDLMRTVGMGCDVVPVAITGGEQERQVGRVWNVPKSQLIGGVQTMLEHGELRIAAKLREREALRRELLDVETSEGPGGRSRFGAEGAGAHDDLVIALALGCWRARRKMVGYMATGRLF